MQQITEELIREIKERIVSAVHHEKIIIFGSYAYGTSMKDNNMDLLVFKCKNKPQSSQSIKTKNFADFAVTTSAFICGHLWSNKLIFRHRELHNNLLVKRPLCI